MSQTEPLNKPVNETIERFKLNILENCLSFTEEAIQKSIASKENSRSWKFAIVHAVQAIELSLKELLRREHPAFIFTDIDNPKHTVSIDLAIKRLSSLARTSLTQKDIEVIKEAQKIRNEIIHKEVDFSIEQVRLLFAKLIGFLSYFHETHLDHHLIDNLPHDQYEFVLKNQGFAKELEERALQRIVEEGLSDDEVIYCPFCFAKTLVLEKPTSGTCYICRLNEHVDKCAGCETLFTEGELTDFSEHFEYSNEGRQYTLEDDFGYRNHKSCQDCIDSIVEDIKNKRAEQLHDHMEMEYHYQIKNRD